MQGVFMEKDTLWTSCGMKCMGQKYFVKQCLEIRSSLFYAFSDLMTNLQEDDSTQISLRTLGRSLKSSQIIVLQNYTPTFSLTIDEQPCQ